MEFNLSSNFNNLYIDGLLTQWSFHRVQEHPKRRSNEEVMTYRSWRSHLVTPSRANLNWPRCSDMSELGLTPNFLPRHMNGILTQWDFHRVQEHPKRGSDEEVMTFRSWRSHVVKSSRADLNWLRCFDLSKLCLTPNVLPRHMNGILTQWASIESKNTQNRGRTKKL